MDAWAYAAAGAGTAALGEGRAQDRDVLRPVAHALGDLMDMVGHPGTHPARARKDAAHGRCAHPGDLGNVIDRDGTRNGSRRFKGIVTHLPQ